MQKQTLIVIGVLIALALGAWALTAYIRSQQVDPVVLEQIDWKIVDQGVDPDTGGTRAQVLMAIAGVDVAVGVYRGTCAPIDGAQVALLPNEVSGVICTRDGVGREVGIFNEGGQLVLMEGEVGTSTSGMTRTGFERLERF